MRDDLRRIPVTLVRHLAHDGPSGCVSTPRSSASAAPNTNLTVPQTKLANLDLVAVDQHRGVDRFMIDVGVVEAVEVDEQDLFVLQLKLDVVAADGGVVEEDVAVGMPACRGDGLIEQELGTGVGAAHHD